jgi:nitroreductase
MDDSIKALLRAAGQAPSGDNTQPWRFEVASEGRRIAFYLDESRDPSPMNSGQRMARIAVGAAIENLLSAAEALGFRAELERGSSDALAAVNLSAGGSATGQAVPPSIAARATNRRVYDGRAIPAELLEQLAHQTPPLEGSTTHWITAKDRIARLALVIGQADATMFGNPTMRKAFLANVRFDEPPDSAVTEGLSLASLELSAGDRFALKMMTRAPDWLIKAGGADRIFAAKARALVESASGLCLIVTSDEDPQSDVVVGRAMERAWLALTALGLAAQPMMSLPVLENLAERGDPSLIEAVGRHRIAHIGQEFGSAAPEIGGGRLAFLLRFGFAPAPSGRTGRLPLEQLAETVATVKTF